MNEWEWKLLEETTALDRVEIDGVDVGIGDRVRLNPKSRGDILDIVLAGRIATVESIEQDYEGRIHVAVLVEDDPGRDLGALRQPGHRFFYSPDEIDPRVDGGGAP